MKLPLILLAASLTGLAAVRGADSQVAAEAVNALGVDLYRLQSGGADNVLLSPYSIQNALAMTYAGADGGTRAEMQRVLHFPADEQTLDGSFGALEKELADAAAKTVEQIKRSKEFGGPSTPLEFDLANRLFGQEGYVFRPAFLKLVKNDYGAPLAEVDYKTAWEKARLEINQWVAQQTKDRIRDLIPPNGIDADTRLTLVNALYLRAPWGEEFNDKLTKPERFLVHARDAADVPTMVNKSHCGYAHREGYQVVTRPCFGGDLQFVILLPDQPDGLPALEKQLTPKLLADSAHLPATELILHLPKFRLAPPTLALGDDLKALGMKTAFDDPTGSANFDRMAPRTPRDYLFISKVFHKTYLALDEHGTEAAAATAVIMAAKSAMPMPKPNPVELKVDHPFLFAIQHVPSGTCLFLGRVTDPR
jgi:serpin B